MEKSIHLSRRTLLRGAGAAVALPLLDAMAPLRALGEAVAPPPVRMLLYVVGGGAYMPYWTIDDSGRTHELEPAQAVEYRTRGGEADEPLGVLSPTLAPLEQHKRELLVIGGLTLADTGFTFEDGHSREIASLLTGAPLTRERVFCGTSVDQVAARALSGKTYLDALVVGLNGARPGGAKGVGRVYAQHYSWRTATTPTGEERNPRLVFDRLFRGRFSQDAVEGSAASARNHARSEGLELDRRSVLDLVRGEAKRLITKLGSDDRAKLDEYLTSVRDIEKRIEFFSKRTPDPEAPVFDAGEVREKARGIESRIPAERGYPESYSEYDELMIDLIALAFRTDTTRVAVLTHGGYRSYPEVGVKRGHHDCQHHEGEIDKREDLQKIDRFNMGLYARAIEKLEQVPEGDGTLLDHSMAVFATGMSNGNRHAREDLPIILAGRAGGTIRTGRYVDYDWRKRTPLSNLWVEMLRRVGVPTDTFGDSTGGLERLA